MIIIIIPFPTVIKHVEFFVYPGFFQRQVEVIFQSTLADTNGLLERESILVKWGVSLVGDPRWRPEYLPYRSVGLFPPGQLGVTVGISHKYNRCYFGLTWGIQLSPELLNAIGITRTSFVTVKRGEGTTQTRSGMKDRFKKTKRIWKFDKKANLKAIKKILHSCKTQSSGILQEADLSSEDGFWCLFVLMVDQSVWWCFRCD